jgi:hypothetical protein
MDKGEIEIAFPLECNDNLDRVITILTSISQSNQEN